MDKDVEKIIRAVLKREIKNVNNPQHFSYERCPDQIVAKIFVACSGKAYLLKRCETIYEEENFDVYERVDVVFPYGTKRVRNTIALILESPHRDEFDENNNGAARGPAFGVTGSRLNAYLPLVLRKSRKKMALKPGVYDIALINAIQFQCSLGEDTDCFRSKVFNECWEKEEVRNNFLCRVQVFSKRYRNYFFISCCTSFCEGKVNKLLSENNILFFISTHPSSWEFAENRWIKPK